MYAVVRKCCRIKFVTLWRLLIYPPRPNAVSFFIAKSRKRKHMVRNEYPSLCETSRSFVMLVPEITHRISIKFFCWNTINRFMDIIQVSIFNLRTYKLLDFNYLPGL
jgi:hypothetical protein